MLLIKIGDVDYTEYVELGSLSRTQQLNNRSDTLKFSAFTKRPLEQQRIDVREYTRLTEDADSGDTEIFVEELFKESKKLIEGMEIRFGDGQRDDERNKIAHIDYQQNKITLERGLNFTFIRGTKVLLRFFAGEIRSITDKQEGKFYTDARIYSISCVDYKYRLDRENIQEIFINQYMREIMGRILYEFVATDSKLIINPFETPRTPSGVADPMTPDHDDRISGNYSMETSTNGAGIATRTTTIPTTDIF
ncbi:MAG: hypothetical protein LBG52_06920 [Candidatus Peribacteria bacterium]|jgi:hypothetical protein|nr:hypothetical protein [Candidatus Peribacteria bacterium]